MYILCARDIEGRCYVWLSDSLSINWLSLSQGDNQFARAVRKHGTKHFSVALLEEVDPQYGQAWLDQCLGMWIRRSKADVLGYNTTSDSEPKGSPVKKAAQAKAVKEKGEWREYHPPKTPEALASKKEKLRLAKNSVKDYICTSPEGKEYKVTNLNQFCKDFGLNVGHMSSVAGGKRLHHKQWKCVKVEVAKHESESLEGQ